MQPSIQLTSKLMYLATLAVASSDLLETEFLPLVQLGQCPYVLSFEARVRA